MAISSINISMGASYGAYNQKLTQETKAKLQELGINFNPNITEQEGKMLLKKAQDLNNHNNGNDLKNNNKQKQHI